MGVYKTVTNTIKNWLSNNDAINEVTLGDIREVDLSTHTNFPLAHIIYIDNDYEDGYSTYNYQILFLDTFFDEDAKLDILDDMNEVVAEFVKALTNGTLFNASIRIDTAPTAVVMYDQLQNRLYGWSLTFGINTPNGIEICV